jgi:hypothetical protein
MPERQRNRSLLRRFTTELDNALWTLDSFKARQVKDTILWSARSIATSMPQLGVLYGCARAQLSRVV